MSPTYVVLDVEFAQWIKASLSTASCFVRDLSHTVLGRFRFLVTLVKVIVEYCSFSPILAAPLPRRSLLAGRRLVVWVVFVRDLTHIRFDS